MGLLDLMKTTSVPTSLEQALYDLENPNSAFNSKNTQLPSNPITAPIQSLSDIVNQQKQNAANTLNAIGNNSASASSRFIATGKSDTVGGQLYYDTLIGSPVTQKWAESHGLPASSSSSSPGSSASSSSGIGGGGSMSGGGSGGGTTTASGSYSGPSWDSSLPEETSSSSGLNTIADQTGAANTAKGAFFTPATTEVTGSLANAYTGSNNDLNKLYQTYADRLGQTYKDTVQRTVNNLNSRGLFGSGIANADIGKVNQNYAQSLSDLAGNIVGQESAANAQSVQNYATLADLDLKQKQLAIQEAAQKNNQSLNFLSLFS